MPTQMKFSPLVGIDVSSISAVDLILALPDSCDCIWLPKRVVVNGSVYANPTAAVVGLKVNDQQGQPHPFAIQDGYLNKIAGFMQRLYATVLTPFGAPGTMLYFATGQAATGSYCSSDGLSPSFAPGSYTSGQSAQSGAPGAQHFGGAYGVPVAPGSSW